MLRPMRPVAESDIAGFEKRNGVSLPEAYRRFLQEQNGGRPRDGEFPVPGWGVTVIDFFFGVGTGDSYDLQKHMDRLQNPRNTELMPIATDPGGWHVFLCVRGPHIGGVYFWDHKAAGSQPLLIAPDFDSFVSSLKPDGAHDDYEFGVPPSPNA